MFPEITVHRPRGVLPRFAVRRRTVVDYQPSWLLLLLPAAAVLATRKSKSRAQTRSAQPAAGTDLPGEAPRRGRRQVVPVRLARIRRRPGSPPADEVTDVAVPAQDNPTA